MKAKKSREACFVEYYSLSIYTLKVLEHTLSMATVFCEHSGVKNILSTSKTKAAVMGRNLTGLLKPEMRSVIAKDLSSDDLMAAGSIMQELISLPSISEAEDKILHRIREIKKETKKIEDAVNI